MLGLLLAHSALGAPQTSAPPREDAARPLRQLEVDAGTSIGRLRSLLGVNGAPAPGTHKPPYFRFGGWNMPEDVDASRGYREAHIDLVRTHDAYGPGDIDAKFGPLGPPGSSTVSAQRDALGIFPDMRADPTDPHSYNFGPTDRQIASIVAVGAQVLFRLGRSETSEVTPPASFERYAAIVEHVVRHYNGGWDRGFHYGIRYWEVWNEPDLGKLFWGGTPQQFFEFYTLLAGAVKRADPAALVGGPTLAKPNDRTPYRDDFLDYVRARNIPLDFFSWHWYATDSDDPLDFVRIGRDVRARLDRHGLQATQSILDEWNYGLVDPPPPDLQRASFVETSLIYMQDAPIDRAALYRADNLFGADGATPDKTGQALIALGRMQATPERVPASGGDLSGFGLLAARSADAGTVQILLSNYRIPQELLGPRAGPDLIHVPNVFDVGLLKRRNVAYDAYAGYELRVTHLARGARYSVERYRISAHDDLSLVERTCQSGDTITLRAALPTPAIELIVIRRAADGR
ncbi:MAG TPA: hypothetical protein VNU73_00990 [Steroidobacteraceae bacterium]|nr:hypothetical protein [Steroidobacteraceae bacterium]